MLPVMPGETKEAQALDPHAPSLRYQRTGRIRRLTQLAFFALLALSPSLNLLRVDIPRRLLVVVGRPLGLGDAYLLLALVLALVLAGMVSAGVLGRVWCGWACPQQSLSELALGVRRRSPWLFYALAAAGALLGGFTLAGYFFSPADIWRGLLTPPPLPPYALALGLTLAALLFVDVAAVGHRICGICPLGLAQTVMVGEGTLRVGVDPRRGAHPGTCATCNACLPACPTGTDPRAPEPERCLTCGICVDVCAGVSAGRGGPQPLAMAFGLPTRAWLSGDNPWPEVARKVGARPWRSGRVAFMGAVSALLLTMVILGIASRGGLTVAVIPERPGPGTAAPAPDAAGATPYTVVVKNREPRPVAVRLSTKDLPAGWEGDFSAHSLTLGPGAESRVRLRLLTREAGAGADEVRTGTYPFRVQAQCRPTRVGPPCRPRQATAVAALYVPRGAPVGSESTRPPAAR